MFFQVFVKIFLNLRLVIWRFFSKGNSKVFSQFLKEFRIKFTSSFEFELEISIFPLTGGTFEY